MVKPIRTALLAVASLALASCGGLSANRPPPAPERCPPSLIAEVPAEPMIPTTAGIVAPCDPSNPPPGTAPEQCEAERAATAAYLASDAERSEWGRGLQSRAAAGKAWCEKREAAFDAETNRTK